MCAIRKQAEESRSYIAEKAKELFAQKGYVLTSIEEICNYTRMSKGNIYHHFKNKESLFTFILELHMRKWIEKWNNDSAGLTTTKEKLYRLAHLFALDYENPLMKAAAEFSMTPVADPEVKAKISEMVNGYYPIIRGVLEEGIRNGEIKPDNPDDLAHVFFGLMSGLGTICYSRNMECTDLYRKAVDFFLKGIEETRK